MRKNDVSCGRTATNMTKMKRIPKDDIKRRVSDLALEMEGWARTQANTE